MVTEVKKTVTKDLSILKSVKSPDFANYLETWEHQASTRAVSFPSFMYTSEEVYKAERERFFSRTWIYVGHTSQLEGANSYFTTSIAEIPLVVVMDKHEVLRAFHNICTHRAAPVAIGNGKCNRFVCPYHAWTFDLEGKLRGVPNFEDYEDFEPSEYNLKSVHVDTWGCFIFVNLDPDCSPLEKQLLELPNMFNGYDTSNWYRAHCVDYYTDTNWKLYVENNAESYHEPVVHRSSYSTGDVSWNNSYELIRCEARHYYYLQYTPYAPDSSEMVHGFKPGIAKGGLPTWLMQGTSIMSFWPNFAWIASPDLIIVYMIDPQGVSRTRVRWDWLIPNTEEAKSAENLERIISTYDKVQQEDMILLPQVQQGIGSPGYAAGPLSPSKEVGVHRFQELLLEHLTGIR